MSSNTYHDVAHVSSVDLGTATVAAGGVGFGSPAVDEDGITIASLDANGLLTYVPARCSTIAISDGAVVKAIRPLYIDGSAQTQADYEAEGGTARKFRPVLLRSVDGGSFTVVHDAAPPVAEWEAYERFACQYEADVVMGNAWVYVQWDYVGGVRRWRCASWGAYIPGDATRWTSPPPTLAWDALDRLAARAPLVDSGTTAITNGVPAVVWSKTVAEDSALSGTVTIHGVIDNAGTTEDSYIVAEFRARRTTGNPPTVVTVSATEDGSFGLGAVAVAINGNDVEIQVTYNADFTLTWTRVDATREVLL